VDLGDLRLVIVTGDFGAGKGELCRHLIPRMLPRVGFGMPGWAHQDSDRAINTFLKKGVDDPAKLSDGYSLHRAIRLGLEVARTELMKHAAAGGRTILETHLTSVGDMDGFLASGGVAGEDLALRIIRLRCSEETAVSRRLADPKLPSPPWPPRRSRSRADAIRNADRVFSKISLDPTPGAFELVTDGLSRTEVFEGAWARIVS
jgi:hypothetical protein